MSELTPLVFALLRSHDAKDPTNGDTLETFLTAYDHVPTELPAGFTH